MMPAFVLLSSARSGSSLLVNYLNCHSDIWCRGEILNGDGRKDAAPETMGRDALCEYVRSAYSDSRGRLVGSKVHTHHFDELPIDLGAFLDFSSAARTIVLYRRNALEAYVSLKVAQRNNLWYSTRLQNQDAVAVDWSHFLRYRERERDRWRRCLNLLAARECESRLVSYEDLVMAPQSVLHKLFCFLDVAPCDVATESVRQNPRPLSEKISNWASLPLAGEGDNCTQLCLLPPASAHLRSINVT